MTAPAIPRSGALTLDAYDNFPQADGTTLIALVPDDNYAPLPTPHSTLQTGEAWRAFGEWTIVGHAVRATRLVGPTATYAELGFDTTSLDHELQVTLATLPTSELYLVARYATVEVPTETFIGVICVYAPTGGIDGTGAFWFAPGTAEVDAPILVPGDVLGFRTVGAGAEVTVNGVIAATLGFAPFEDFVHNPTRVRVAVGVSDDVVSFSRIAALTPSGTAPGAVWGAHVWAPDVWAPHVWSDTDDLTPEPEPEPEPEPPAPGGLVAGKYASDHASARADLEAAGAAPVIFTRDDGTTIAGAAVEVAGDPIRYQLAELVLSTMPALLFAPDVYGLRAFTPSFVLPGDRVVWNDVGFVVKDVNVTAPDGVVIVSNVVVA